MNRALLLGVGVFALGTLSGVALERGYGTGPGPAQAQVFPALGAAAADQRPLLAAHRHTGRAYVCPMHPQVLGDHPGHCPICGMDLVAREGAPPDRDDHPGADPAGDDGLVAVPGALVERLGVRTVKVGRGRVARPIEAPGYAVLGAAGRAAPVTGTRTAPFAVAGAPPAAGPDADANPIQAMTAQPLTVWVQVFERQAAWVRPGQAAQVRFPSLGPESWVGQVESVDPTVNRTTGTVQLRIRLDSLPASIRPNMYAQVRIDAEPLEDSLTVPREALIETEHATRVIVALGGGRFVPRAVRAQQTGSDQAAVLEGLTEGEEVVVAAQFLLDAEANVQAGLRRLNAGEVMAAAPHLAGPLP